MNRLLVLLLLALGSGVASLAAQGRPLTVSRVRDLTFGMVLPGVPRVILRTDPTNSGQFDLVGNKNSQVLLTFALPLVMTGPASTKMPLVFRGSDGGYSSTQAIGSQVAFDPKQPFLATLSKNGRGSVFIGGTAQPSTSQRAGPYTGTLALTVVYFP